MALESGSRSGKQSASKVGLGPYTDVARHGSSRSRSSPLGQRRFSIAHALLAPTHGQLGLDLLKDRRSSLVEALAVTFGPCRPSGALRLY